MKKVLYTIISRQGIFKNAKLWGAEGEDEEEKGDGNEKGNGEFGMAAGYVAFLEFFTLIEKRNCRCNKEDGDVQPIGGFPHGAVVGIKNDGDQDLPEKDAPQFYAPKIRPFRKEKTLYDGKGKHRPKE